MASVSGVFSLRPELEFEILKLILLRERYIKRIKHALDVQLLRHSKNKSTHVIDLSVIGIIDVLREITIELMEVMRLWEQYQLDYPDQIHPFRWNGEDYLVKIANDTEFLSSYDAITNWLGFNIDSNPFFIPHDVLSKDFSMPENSFLVFGRRPYDNDEAFTEIQKKMFKSPYLTPIINDPEVIPSLSMEHKLRKLRKLNKLIEQANKKREQQRSKDPYEVYISALKIEKIRSCWTFLSSRLSLPNVSTDIRDQLDLNSDIQADNKAATSPQDQDYSFSRPIQVNEYMRICHISNEEKPLEDEHKRSPYLWNPHDKRVQKIIEKRGGELSLMTAAGVKGRMKAPRRKTRFERLDIDIANMTTQYEAISMNVEDMLSLLTRKSPSVHIDVGTLLEDYEKAIDLQEKIHVNLKLLQNQKKTFQMVSKTQSKGQLISKEAVPNDQTDTIIKSFEDKMAVRIQSFIRRILCRRGRNIIFNRYHQAAIKIQCLWRRHNSSKRWNSRTKLVQFAILLQSIYRQKRARNMLQDLRIEARSLTAAITIQRIYRGYYGRRRFFLRREFLQNISNAGKIISSYELVPAHIDALADEIESHMTDSSSMLSLNILSILRSILYMLNGDDKSENIIIYRNGSMASHAIYTSDMTWYSILIILRRKGRLLRRLRALVQSVSVPNPVPLNFCDACVQHLLSIDTILPSAEKIVDHIHYFGIKSKLGKECLMKISLFCRYMIRIHQLQGYFPEYFIFRHEHWFKALMKHQYHYEKMNIQLLIETTCRNELEIRREYCLNHGKKLGPVLAALKSIVETINHRKSEHKAVKKALFNYSQELEDKDRKKLFIFQNTEGTMNIGIKIAKKELQDHLDYVQRQSVLPSNISPAQFLASTTAKTKELEAQLDRKELSLIEIKAKIKSMEMEIEKKLNLINYRKLINLDRGYILSIEYGKLLSEVLILQQIWNNFVNEIGGAQYGSDLIGDKQNYFQNLKKSVNNIMIIRCNYINEIDAILKNAFDKFDQTILNVKSKLLIDTWDQPNIVEYLAEENENISLAKRDANKLNYLTSFIHPISIEGNILTIPTSSSYYPVLILIDINIPEIIKNQLISKLEKFKFERCVCGQDSDDLLHHLQQIIDQSKHPILLVDQGINSYNEKRFYHLLRNIVMGLSLRPKVILINHPRRYEPWHAQYSVRPSNLINSKVNHDRAIDQPLLKDLSQADRPADLPMDLDFLLGKLRHISILYRQILWMNNRTDEDHYKASFYISSSLRNRFQWDYLSLIVELEHFVSFQDNKSSIMKSTIPFYSKYSDKAVQYHAELLSKTDCPIVSPMTLLIASLSVLFGIWKGPVIGWTDRHISIACSKYLNLTIENLFDRLFLDGSIDCNVSLISQIDQIKRTKRYWEKYAQDNFYDHPARSLLAQWCLAAVDYIER